MTPLTASPSSRTASVQVIERMMSLIDALAKERESVSLKQLSLTTRLHPSTAHRILNDMVLSRFVDRTEPGRYRLGMRLLELGNMVRSRLPVRDAALEPMRALHERLGQTIELSMRQGDELVCVERAGDQRSSSTAHAIGGRAPLHLTAAGKLFLAIEDPRQVRAYAMRTLLVGRTVNSVTELVDLERELSQVRARGYSRDDEELELGVCCIAVSIRDDSNKVVAGLTLSAPAGSLDDAWMKDLARTASRISTSIGAQ